jgi:hypothetical protein
VDAIKTLKGVPIVYLALAVALFAAAGLVHGGYRFGGMLLLAIVAVCSYLIHRRALHRAGR